MDSDAFDSVEAYDYLAGKIRDGERVLPYEVEEEARRNRFYQQDGATAQTDVVEAGTLLNDAEINSLLQIAEQEERKANAQNFEEQDNESSDDTSRAQSETAQAIEQPITIGTQSNLTGSTGTEGRAEGTSQNVATQTREELRPIVERIAKRRAAAQQLNKEKAFDNLLAMAKSAMAGMSVNVSKLKLSLTALKNDVELNSAITDLIDAVKAPQAEALKSARELAQSYRAQIESATTLEQIDTLAIAIQSDANLSDEAASMLDELAFDKRDSLDAPELELTGQTNAQINEDIAQRKSEEEAKTKAEKEAQDKADKEAAAEKQRENARERPFTFGEDNAIVERDINAGVNDLFSAAGEAQEAAPQDEVSRAKAALDQANITGAERLDVVAKVRAGGLTADDVIEAHGGDSGNSNLNKRNETPISMYDNIMDEFRKGIASVDDYKAAFNYVLNNEKLIVEHLESNFTKAKLFERGGSRLESRYKSEKKDRVTRALYSEMVKDFILPSESGMTSYSYGYGEDKYADVIRQVNQITQESLNEAMGRLQKDVENNKAKITEQAEGIDNPKTLDDYQNLMRDKSANGMSFQEARMSLTPEQRAQYDELVSDYNREQRKQSTNSQKTQVHATESTTTGEVVETKHTKTKEPLFVVKTAERVERETYNQWNATAKRMGGYYSSYRGGGAVAGFQFKAHEDAEAFLKYIGGDTTQAKEAIQAKRDTYADDKSQTAVERLTEMATRLEESADAELSRERKANTARRAGMAARAEANANADKAMSITMRNIAQSIKSGAAKYLDQVRQKTQVELLQTLVSNAHYKQISDKYKGYAEREKHKYDPADSETADFAEFPSYTLYRSDWARLGRAMSETDGLKQLGAKILSVANDVTDAYVKFAKDNIDKVGTYMSSSGLPASFTSKVNAEASIARSGYSGKAIAILAKRGEYRIIDSPSAAMEKGVWSGDSDKRITLGADFVNEVVEKVGKSNRRNNKLELPWQLESIYDRRMKLKRMGIETPAELRSALREFIGLKESVKAPDKIKELERSMVGRRNDGLDFFPTPASVSDEMITTADIKEGMSVLEPSAGMGHIADRIRESGNEPDVVEISVDRRELLEAKGYNVVANDFMAMAMQDTPNGEGYDRIIMNPPFSDRRDMQHIQHAYSLLKPNGRVVAIVGEGVFFGSDKRATGFRDWVKELGGTSEKLDEGTFMDASLPVNTSVNARMLVIDKQETDSGNVAMFSRSNAKPSLQDQLQSVVDGDNPVKGNILTISDNSPASLQMLGFDNLPVVTRTGADGVLKMHYEHGLSVSKLASAIENGLKRPAMILQHKGRGDVESLRFVTNETHNGKPVILAIQPEKQGDTGKVQLIATAFEIDASTIDSAILNGNLLYRDTTVAISENTKKALTRAQIKNAREPRSLLGILPNSAPSRRQAYKILSQSDIVKFENNNEGAYFSRGISTTGLPKQSVQKAVNAIRANWKNAPEVVVVSDMNDPDIPESVRKENARQLSQGAKGQPEGFFYNGKVYILASEMNSPADIVRVLFHETLGHYGLRGTFGKELGAILDQVAMLRKNDMTKKAKQYGLDLTKESDRRIAAEEVLAEMSQTAPSAGFVKRAIAAIRKFLRDIGVKLELSDNDIIVNYLLPARRYVVRGTQGSKLVGSLATAFSRNSPIFYSAQKLNAAMVKHFDISWENAYDQTDLPDSLADFAKAAEVAYGATIAAIRPTEGRFNIFNGINVGKTNYINIESDVSFINITGHELYHDIERNRPDLHEWLKEQAQNHYQDFYVYKDKLNALVQEGEKKYTNETAQSELLADLMGDAMADPVFLGKLAEANPSKFKQLLKYVTQWLSDVANKLKKKDLGSSQYFDDVEAMRRHLNKVITAYSLGKNINELDAPVFSRESLPSNSKDPYQSFYDAMMPNWEVDKDWQVKIGKRKGALAYKNSFVTLTSLREVEHIHGLQYGGDRFEAFDVRDNKDGLRIGAVVLEIKGNKPVALHDIFILKTDREKGYGKKIVGALLSIAPERSMGIVEIINSSEGFWRKSGVHTIGYNDGNSTLTWNDFAESTEAARGGKGSLQPSFSRTASQGYGEDVIRDADVRGRDGLQGGLDSSRSTPSQGTPATNNLIQPETKLQALQRTMQDDAAIFKRTQEMLIANGGKVTDRENVYEAMMRYPSRFRNRIKDFMNDTFTPLVERMAKADTDFNELGRYMLALHAEEGNAYVQTISSNPKDGVGMTNAEASKVIADARAKGNFAEFDSIARAFQAITDRRLDMLVAANVYTADQAAAMRSQYKFYVPVKGFADLDLDDLPANYTGGGLSTSKRLDMRRKGRQSEPGQIIENIISK